MNKIKQLNSNEIIIFKTEDDKISVDVRFGDETVWLTLDQMAMLFDRDKSTISRHVKNVFEERELDINSTVAKFATVQIERARHEQAIDKATTEYKKYQQKTLSEVEKSFLDTIQGIWMELKGGEE
jgi:hypothetical protein